YLTLSLAVVGACQAKVLTTANVADQDAGVDAASKDPAPDAVMLGPWGSPQKIAAASTAGAEDDGTLSSDRLELVFALVEPGDNNNKHLSYAQRASLADTFGPAQRVGFAITGTTEQTPRFSADDKILYFASNRLPTLGGLDVWQIDHSAP